VAMFFPELGGEHLKQHVHLSNGHLKQPGSANIKYTTSCGAWGLVLSTADSLLMSMAA
jgi:hypothetical protein